MRIFEEGTEIFMMTQDCYLGGCQVMRSLSWYSRVGISWTRHPGVAMPSSYSHIGATGRL